MIQSQLPNLEIRKIQRLRGPNIWSNRAVLEAWVDLGIFEEYPSNRLEGFTERLMRWLPSLVEHRCSIGERGGFLMRLRDGTWMGHVLEHVTLELQSLAHSAVGYGRARETGQYGVYRVVIECLDHAFGERALHEARSLVHAAARGEEFDVAACLARLVADANQVCLEPNTARLVAAATRLGFPVTRLSTGNLVQLGYGKNSRRAWSAQTDRTAAVAGAISQNPELSTRLLKAVGLRTTDGREVDTLDQAWEAARDLGGLVAVRPAGKRRSADLPPIAVEAGKSAIEAAYNSSVSAGSGVVVERWVSGELHRVLVVGHQAVASQRVGASAIQTPKMSLEPETAAACVLAARTVGLDVAGVDVITQDANEASPASSGVIADVSANPDLTIYQASEDPGVGDAVIRHLFDGALEPTFPVLSVSGGGPLRAKVAARLSRLVETTRESSTALVGEAGVWLSNDCVYPSDGRNFDSGVRVLTHPCVEAAVFEVLAAQVLEEGLPFTYCNVAIILSTSEQGAATGPWEAPPYLTPELVRKAVRAPADVVPANGCLILDASVEGIAAMAERCPGRVLYFSADPNNAVLRAHLAAGERAVTVEDGRLTYFAPSPIDLGQFDDVSRETVYVVLPCAAALLALGVPVESVRRALFDPSAIHPSERLERHGSGVVVRVS